jgi:hypothetical protein
MLTGRSRIADGDPGSRLALDIDDSGAKAALQQQKITTAWNA